MALRSMLAMVVVSAGALTSGCDNPIPPPDPQGKDMVVGAVVAAVTQGESTPGIRTYKVLHVDDYPEPIGWELHLAAYDPKASTFEEARATRRRGGMKVVLPHFEVHASDFLKRDHRVIAIEPLTDAELAAYNASRRQR